MIAGNAKFGGSWLKKSFLLLHFIEDMETGHQQLHLPYSNNNQFKDMMGKFLDLIDLFKAQTLCVHKLLEVVVLVSTKILY